MWMNLSHLDWHWGLLLMEECQPNSQRSPFPVKYRSGCLVCMTRQSCVMWNPCVRVTHLMLTLKVWPSHAWVHMCEARRLRCDTHTLARTSTIFTSNIPSTPRLQPLDLIQLLCVCEKEQDTSSQEHEWSNKTQIRDQWTFSQTSEQRINIFLAYARWYASLTFFAHWVKHKVLG